MGLEAVGTFLSGVGSLGGLFGSSSDGIDVSENIRLQRESMNQTMLSAKKHGLHPLFALGAGMGQSPSFIAGHGDKGGSKAAQAAGAVGDAIQKYTNRKYNEVLEDLGVRQARADVRSSEIAADLAALELQRARDALVASPVAASQGVADMQRAAMDQAKRGSTKTYAKEQTARSRKDSSSEAGSNPGFKSVEVAPGRFAEVPTEMEMDEVMSPGMMLMIMRSLGLLKGYDDPKTMTEQTHKQFKKWGYKPRKQRNTRGQMGRRSRW